MCIVRGILDECRALAYSQQRMGWLIFDSFPLPPTSNNIHATIMVGGQLRRINSKEYQAFLKDAKIWAARNNDRLNVLKKLCMDAIAKDKMISIDAYFCFTHEQLWTQKNKPKKIDGSNRIKPCHDALAMILGIDDCMFWRGTFEKIEAQYAKTILHFQITEPRKAIDLGLLLGPTKHN